MTPKEARRIAKLFVIVAITLFFIEVSIDRFYPMPSILIYFTSPLDPYLAVIHHIALGLFCFGMGALGMFYELNAKKDEPHD